MSLNTAKTSIKRPRLPDWIRVKPYTGTGREDVNAILKGYSLNTVCQSAKCPNIGECWHKRTATFMIMGSNCTRNCRFCAVNHAIPPPPDREEPIKVAMAVKKMNLHYAVITSVTRDDLEDGGATIFAQTIKAIKEISSNSVKVEVLTPDFNCSIASLKIVAEAAPDVFNHNVETVKRLSERVRSKATYDKSLFVLEKFREISGDLISVKSGIMVGLGETDSEVEETIIDIRKTGATILTIGQYLPPTADSYPLDRYVHPDKFQEWKIKALSLGFKSVASGPLVRSSYMAENLADPE